MESNKKNQERPPLDRQPEKKNFVRVAKFLIFESAVEFALYIAVPLLVLLYFGKRLDASHHTKIYVILAILLAILISASIIGKRINQIRRMLK